jgi:hypothetical protein
MAIKSPRALLGLSYAHALEAYSKLKAKHFGL